MKAILLEKPFTLRLIDVPEPPPPGRGEATVRVHRVGICGTDISGYLGRMPFFSYPRIPGHELGVEVIRTGDEVTNVRPGDRCAVEPYLNCGACHSCRRGATNCCEQLKVLGVMTDGGMCERLTLPAQKLHSSATLSFDQLALVETLGIGCHAVNRGAPAAGETVLVIGAGPIGLSLIEFVKLSGAVPVVMDLNESRLAFCRETMGVGHIILSRGDGADVERLADLTGGRLAQVVFDATGNHDSMSRALTFASFTGRIVFAGITPHDVVIADPLLHRRELTVMATRNALPADFTRIIRLIEAGEIDTRPWITHRAPMEAVIDEFPRWTRTEVGVIKAMLTMHGS